MTLNSDAKFEEKLTLGSKNDGMRTPHVIFGTKSQFFFKFGEFLCEFLCATFIESILSLSQKVQRSYVS